MKPSAKAVALIAGVATGAVAISAVLVARQVPTVAASGSPSVPIDTAIPSATPSRTPSTTPKPSTTPSKTPAPAQPPVKKVPVTITVDQGSLERGAAPKIPYVDERTLYVGNTKVTTKSPIVAGQRAGAGILAVVAVTDSRTELEVFDAGGKLTGRVPDVSSLLSTADRNYSAYSTSKLTDQGDSAKGSRLTWRDNAGGKTQQLSRPADYEVRILAVTPAFVYFASQSSPSARAQLYKWAVPGTDVSRLDKTKDPTAVSANGSQAGMLTTLSDEGSCSQVADSYGDGTYWKTCDYQIDEFSPAAHTVLGGPAYRDGYGAGFAAVLDNSNGKLVRKWQGMTVMDTGYEDEDHVLLVTEKGSRGAIVRCSISSGRCELATPYVEGLGDQAVGNPYKLG